MTTNPEPSEEGRVPLSLRDRVEAFWAQKRVQNVIITLILINAALLGMGNNFEFFAITAIYKI